MPNQDSENYLIISSNKEKPIALTISEKTGIPVGDVHIHQVHGTETSVDIDCFVNNKTIFLIYNITQPINESIMQILFLADAIRKEGANKIYWITTYLPYTKIKYETEYKLNFNLFTRLLDTVNIDRIYTFGLYAPKISFYLRIPLYNIPLNTIFANVLENNFSNNKNIIVTSLDYELQIQANYIAKTINAQTVFPIIKKTNNKLNFEINENISGKDILVVGDTINTGKNIIEYAKYLTYKGVNNVFVLAPQGITNEKVITDLEKSLIKEIYVISNPYRKCEKIKVVPVTKILIEIIKRTIDNKTINNILK